MRLSKEEILDKNEQKDDWDISNDGWQKWLLDSMDEFAKQEAIGFAKWKHENYSFHHNAWHQRGMSISSVEQTEEEFYELYIKSKTV
jgi:argininosuccinate synthase